MSKIREISRNLISFSMIDIIGMMIPIITMPILTRTLGANAYGVYLLIMTILYFGHTVIDYGTQYTSVRKLSNNRSDREKKSLIFSQTQSLKLVLSIGYIFSSLIYGVAFGSDEFYIYVTITVIPYLIGYALTPTWYYQGMSDMNIVMKVAVTNKIINLFVILFLVKNESDIALVLLSVALPSFFGGLFLMCYCIKKEALNVKLSYKIWHDLKEGSYVFIGLLSPNLYNSIPTIVLGTSYPPDQFAKFAVASRLCSVVISIQNVLAKSVYPVVSRMKDSQVSKLVLANLLVSIPPIIYIFFWGEYTLSIFLGKSFSSANDFLTILVVGVAFSGLANSYAQGYFLPKNLDVLYRNISLRVSIISGLCSTVLIYYFGLFGGAFGITLARFLFFIDYYFSYKKIVD